MYLPGLTIYKEVQLNTFNPVAFLMKSLMKPLLLGCSGFCYVLVVTENLLLTLSFRLLQALFKKMELVLQVCTVKRS